MRAVRGKEGGERDTEEVKKNETKQKKKVRFAEGDVQNKRRGDGDEMREDQAQYQGAVNSDTARQREANEDADQRESRNTGGSRASSGAAPGDTDEHEAAGGDEEMDEGRTPVAMTVPDGPSNHEREENTG